MTFIDDPRSAGPPSAPAGAGFVPRPGGALARFDPDHQPEEPREPVAPVTVTPRPGGALARFDPYPDEADIGLAEPKAPQVSTAGAFGRGVARGVVPTLVGTPPAILGAMAGAAAGVPLDPLTFGGASIVGAIIGGAAGGFGGGYVGDVAQEYGLGKLDPDIVKAIGQDAETRQADVEQHPYASFLGGLTPNLLFMRPGASVTKTLPEGASAVQKWLAKPLPGRLLGSTIFSSLEAGQEYATEGTIDPAKVGMAAVFGAAANKPTVLGQKIEDVGTHAVRRAFGLPTGEVAPAAPPQPTPEAQPEAPAEAPAVTPPSQEAAPAATPGAPDVHAVARTIAPDTFREYDELTARRATFRNWLENVPQGAPVGADMAKVARDIRETESRLRELAPDVAEAYRKAGDASASTQQMPAAEPAAPPPPPSREEYVARAMDNLRGTSRTVAGTLDLSSTPGKAERMAEGLTAEGAAQSATQNFENVIRDLHARKDNLPETAEGMAPFIDDVARRVNEGIVKPDALDRVADTKFPNQTAAADLPAAKAQFAEELTRRLNDPKADPVETAAWIEWRANLMDHFWSDGVGKTSKALAAVPLMRAGLPLPTYPPNKTIFNFTKDVAARDYNGPAWDKFNAYYHQMVDPKGSLRAMLDRNAPLDELTQHPYVQHIDEQNKRAIPTGTPEDFVNPEWRAARTYDFNGEQVRGWDAAIDRLTDQAKAYAGPEGVANDRHAVIILGPPAAGKSSIANPIARKFRAAVVDADDAKLPIKEYRGGVGTAAVHEESSVLAKDVLGRVLDEGGNVVLPKVGNNPESIRRTMAMLKAMDYKVDLVHTAATPEISGRRNIKRMLDTGRLVPPEYIAAVGDKPRETSYLLRGEANDFLDVDTSRDPARIVAGSGPLADAVGNGRDVLPTHGGGGVGGAGALPGEEGGQAQVGAGSSFITQDVASKLIAAGRPPEEAQSAGLIHQAYWETRAARFKGARGTAEEMYRREAPEIRGVGAPVAAPQAPSAPTPADAALPPTLRAAPLPSSLPNNVQTFAPGDLLVDAKRFQFKDGGDEAGVTDRLKGVTKWDPVKAGMVLVWQDAQGKNFIVDGHQRHALALRIAKDDPAQKPELLARVMRESEGVSDVDAKVTAAAKNIAEGTGTAVDAAKVLRERPDLISDLPPRSELVRQARGLVNLSDDAFRMIVNDVVPPSQGAIVGRLVPGDPGMQAALIDLLAKTEPSNAVQAETIVRQGIEAGMAKREKGAQGSLFGEDDIATSLYLDRAKVLDKALAEIRRDKRVFSVLTKEQETIEASGNRLAADINQKRAAADAQALHVLQLLASRRGPISEALGRAADRARADGKPGLAARGFVGEIRGLVESGDLARLADGLERGPAHVGAEDATGVVERSPERGSLAAERRGDAEASGVIEEAKASTSAQPGPQGEEASPPEQEAAQRVLFQRSLMREREAQGQMGMFGMERASDAEMARRRAAAPLRPRVEQTTSEMPLFGGPSTQPELFGGTGGTEPAPGPNGEALRAGASALPQGGAPGRARGPTPVRGVGQLSLFGGEPGERAPGPRNEPAHGEQGGAVPPLPSASEGVTKPPSGGRGDDQARPDTSAGARGLSAAEEKIAERSRSNYRITDDDKIGDGGPKEKVRGNLDAIRTLKTIEDEGREATAEEKARLVKYTGWGAHAQEMFKDDRASWKAERDQLRALLTDEEYEGARASTPNAHFTSPEVIRGMWAALDHLGFTGGMALEPAAGTGHFIGLIPDTVAPKTAWTATELDPISGRIAKALYGGAEVNVQGFETLKRPSNYYDLAISNVPFGDYPLKEKPYGAFPIHDFFFVKSLDKVRPGGVVAFVTSRYSMDRVNPATRNLLGKTADLVGAVRLPGGRTGAFAKNAGTEVTTDVLFLRKKIPGETAFPGQAWSDLKEVQTPDGPTRINEYFADHPEMMLGEMRLQGTQYRANEPVLVGDTAGIEDRIAIAARNMPANAMTPTVAPKPAAIHATEIEEGVKDGAFFVKDGKVYQRQAGQGEAADLSAEDHARVSKLVGMRGIVNDVLGAQLRGEDAEPHRARLRQAYDQFVAAHGPINLEERTVTKRISEKTGEPVTIVRMPNFKAFKEDPDAYKVAMIEKYDSETGKASRASIQTKDVIDAPKERQINGPADALAASLNDTGGVDLDHVAASLKLDTQEDASAALGDLVFHNPDGRKWQEAGEYLSGDVVKKLEEARTLARDDPAYLRNVAALERVQPSPLRPDEITAQFGAPWIPESTYEDFFKSLGVSKPSVKRVPVTGEWRLAIGQGSRDAESKFGTGRKGMDEIASAAMNNGQVTVYDKQSDGSRSVNETATEEARVKVQLLKEAFTGDQETGAPGWVWEDNERSQTLAAIYNRTFNNIAPRKFDGSHLTLPGLNPDFATRQHRKDAVWRMIQNGNTLLAHVVGSGKTATMIAGGMEMRRLGLASKPAYVVPNHMLEQFSREFIEAYPNAKILVAQKDEMSRDNRRAFIAKAAANDWDGIIVTHDAFGRVNMAKEFRQKFIGEQLDELERLIKAEKSETGDDKSPTVKGLEKAKKRLKVKLDELMAEERKDEGTTFEESGIDHLFVDEAHKFKNLNFLTRMQRVKGLAQGDSQRAEDLFLKIRYLEQKRPGRSAVFATGTPVSNTMAELWTMMRYLELDKLKERGLDSFDAWASTFGRVKNNMELSADGRTFKDTASFSRFVNIPELINIYGEIADTKTADMLNLKRPEVKTPDGASGIRIVEATPSPAEEAHIQHLVELAESLKGKRPKPGEPNILSVVTQGRKVATDGRLISKDFGFNPNGKIAKAVDNIHRIWQEGNTDPAKPDKVQMVFLDLGTPKSKGGAAHRPIDDETGDDGMDPAQAEGGPQIDLYDDIKKRLVKRGIPAEQIAAIHDAPSDQAKARLFEKVRRGEVRVFLGSTEKMGVGTNVQDRLIAMHHLDAPWKPAEVEQRDGRIVRQHNANPAVQIYRYVTKRSFDAFMWQKLDTKSKFIGQVLSGAKGSRHAEDIDNPLPEAAEMKAAASGDPRIMEHAELDRQVRALTAQRRAFEQTKQRADWELRAAQSRVQLYSDTLPAATADAGKVADISGAKFAVDLGERRVTERADAGKIILDKLLAENPGMFYRPQVVTVGKMSGLDMNIELQSAWSDGGPMLKARFSLKGERAYANPNEDYINKETSPAGLIRRFENLLPKIKDYPDQIGRELETERANTEQLAKTREAQWPKERDYQYALRRLDGLTKALRQKGVPASRVVEGTRGLEMPSQWSPENARELYQIDAYHGSPHHFERFDASKIGTGEGAQAYGHGLYFAEHEGTAGDYRKKLSSPYNVDTADLKMVAGDLPLETQHFQAIRNGAADTSVPPTDAAKRIQWRHPELRDANHTSGHGGPFHLGLTRAIDYARQQGQGSLYKVNLKPDKEDLLDWDRPLSEQSAKVQEALRPLINKFEPGAGEGRLPKSVSGEQLYYAYSREIFKEQERKAPGTARDTHAAMSEALRAAGVPGIRYLDQGSRVSPAQLETMRSNLETMRRSAATAAGDMKAYWQKELPKAEQEYESAKNPTHNFVIFDDKDVEITHRNGEPVTKEERADAVKELYQRGEMAQQGDIKRGKIRLREAGPNTITLLRDANASTFLHETGHDWLDRMLRDAEDADAPADLKADAQTTLKWLGVGSVDEVATRHHEQFARGFENYMMEGRAPSRGLAAVFAKFRDWLLKIYKTATNLKAPLNDEIRGVFDRLLAVDPEKVTIAPDIETGGPMAEDAKARADAELARIVGEHGAGRAAGPGGEAPSAPAEGEGGPEAKSPPPTPEPGYTPAVKNPPPEAPTARFDSEKAGNIRLENVPMADIKDPAAVQDVIRKSAARNDNFQTERRGVISDAEAIAVAEAMGTDPAFLDRKKIGEAWTKEEVFAIEFLLNKSATAVKDAAAKAASGKPEDLLAYEQEKARLQMVHDTIQGKASAARAEAGRTLQGYAALAKMSARVAGTDAGKLIQEVTGKTLFQSQREANFASKLYTPQQVAKFMSDSARNGFQDKIIFYYVNALISGPITHLRYSIGNAINALERPLIEIPLAAAYGRARETLGYERAADRVFLGEAGAQLYGLLKGSRDGMSSAVDAFTSGVSPPLPGERLMHDIQFSQPIPGVVGTALSVPGRSVAGIHSFFKSVRYEQEIQGLAYRTATREGREGDAKSARIAELTTNPTPAMMDAATKTALRELYMAPTDYDSAMGSLVRFTNRNLLAKIVVPFMKIGSQITRQAFLERTPLGIADKEVRANLTMQGGTQPELLGGGQGPGAAFDMQAAKITAGVSLMGATVLMAAEGMITGDGPSDPDRRRVWLLNHRPNTMQVGNITIPFQGLGHLGMLTRFSANMYDVAHAIDAEEDWSKVAASFFHGLSDSVLDENFMRGVKDMLDALYHPEEYGEAYVRQFATNWLPFSVGLGQVARESDPLQREVHTIFEAAQAKVPGYREGLLPKRDMFGEPIGTGGLLTAGREAAPTEAQRYANDPVVRAMDALQIGIAPLPRKIAGIKLTDEQYDDFARVAGRMTKVVLDDLVAQPGFNAIPPGERIDMIHKIITTQRAGAANFIKAQYAQDIVTKALAAKAAKFAPETVH